MKMQNAKTPSVNPKARTVNPAENPSANLGANLAAKQAANPTANPTAKPRQTRAGFAFLGLIVALVIIALLGGAGAFYFSKTAKDAKKTAQQVKQAQIKKDEVIGDIIVPTPQPTPPPVIVPPTPTPPTEPPIVSVYRYGRTLLNDNEKAAYDEILSQALQYEGTLDASNIYYPRLKVTLKANIDFNTLLKVARYLSADCPECFHISSFSPSYDYTADYKGFVREYWVRILAGYDTKEKYFAGMNQILAKTQPIFEKMNAATSQIDKIKIAHDEMLKIMSYGGMSNASAGRIVGAFIEGKVVCEGYSRALLFLLQRGGLKALYTAGYADTGKEKLIEHAWNVVQDNGVWYFIDSTWDDGMVGSLPSFFHHDHFMKGTDDFIRVDDKSIGKHQYIYNGENAASYATMPTMSKTSLVGAWDKP